MLVYRHADAATSCGLVGREKIPAYLGSAGFLSGLRQPPYVAVGTADGGTADVGAFAAHAAAAANCAHESGIVSRGEGAGGRTTSPGRPEACAHRVMCV